MVHRALIVSAVLTALSATQPQAPYGQRASRILDEIIKVIDGIEARQATRVTATERSLFDDKTLGQWKRTEFSGGGDARVDPKFRNTGAAIVVESGATLSGIHWTGDVPRSDYEISLEFMKIEGSDFACGLTFPVGDSHATLVLGGWGGGVVGLSSIDGHDASENETTTYLSFAAGRWYRVRARVTASRIEAWLDGKRIVDASIGGRTISLRHGEISRSVPLGLATYQTSAAFRAITLRRPAPPDKPQP